MTRRAFDVAALEDLAVVKKKTEADTIGARVIGAPLSPQFRVLRLRIDRGEREVAAKMPVITSEGPVGTISTVYGDYADVQLISEKDYKIDVVIKRTGARGSLIGQGNPDTYACTLESDLQAKPEMRVQVGDEVVASGVGSPYPAGLLVGRVTKLLGNDGLFQRVEVEPIVNVSRVRAVMVLLAGPPPADPDAKTKKRSEPAFGGKPL